MVNEQPPPFTIYNSPFTIHNYFVVRGLDLEIVGRIGNADELGLQGQGIGQPILPLAHRSFFVLNVVFPQSR